MESPKEITVSDVIKIVLESQNPALFFLHAKSIVGDVIFEHSIDKVLRYSNEFDLVLEEIAQTPQQPTDNKEKKPANGIGTLKAFVGKGEDDEFTTADAKTVGVKLADMEGEEKMEFVGMMNFLGASCRIYNQIRINFNNAIKKGLAGESGERLYTNIAHYLRSLQGNTARHNAPNESVSEEYFLKELLNVSSLLEALSPKDIVKMSILLISEMSDEQICDGIAICEARYSEAAHAAVRDRQNNGKGGLKELAGKTKGQYLEPSDSKVIASKILAQKDSDQKNLYYGYVALLGAMCPLYQAMKTAYRNKVKNKQKAALKNITPKANGDTTNI